MSQSPPDSIEADFADQLEILANQATQHLGDRAPKQPAAPNFSELLRPLVSSIEALNEAASQNAAALGRIENAASSQASMPAAVTALQETLAQKNSVNQKLFDAMHEELRTYKDGFLLEVFHKPIVRDLITLYDDLSLLEHQTDAFLAHLTMRNDLREDDILIVDQMRNMATNLSHGVHSLVETMARMEVTKVAPHAGKIDRQLQRAISMEATNNPQDDGVIARSLKPGFQWRSRTVRPEEVVVKKWSGAGNGNSQI